MANVDKKSDSIQIIQAVLDVPNQAIRTSILGSTNIALSYLDGDSVISYGPSVLLESAEVTIAVVDGTVIVPATSVQGLSKFQLYLETTAAITAVGLSCTVEVSPVDVGDIWVTLISTNVNAALGTVNSAVTSTMARRVRIKLTSNAYTAGKFIAHLIGG